MSKQNDLRNVINSIKIINRAVMVLLYNHVKDTNIFVNSIQTHHLSHKNEVEVKYIYKGIKSSEIKLNISITC